MQEDLSPDINGQPDESSSHESEFGPKWKYERKPKPKKPDVTPSGVVSGLFKHAAALIVFVFMPVLTLGVVHWLAKSLFEDTFFDEPWMLPAVLLFSMFFAGVFCRILMENAFRSMGLFFVGIIGFCIFAWICWSDVQGAGSVFSARFLPQALKYSTEPYIYSLPLVGMIGMFCFKWFTLK